MAWPLSLSKMILRFIYVVVCIGSWFLFIAKWFSIVWLNHLQLMNTWVISIQLLKIKLPWKWVQDFMWRYVLVFFRCIPNSRMTGSYGRCMFNSFFKSTGKHFLKWAYHFLSEPAVYESSGSTTFSSTLGMVRPFYLAIRGCVVSSHYVFIYIYLMNNYSDHFFSYSYSLLVYLIFKMCTQILGHLYWVILLLFTKLSKLFILDISPLYDIRYKKSLKVFSYSYNLICNCLTVFLNIQTFKIRDSNVQ